MEFYMKLPRNKREFILFLLIVSLISVNLIAPLISCLTQGFSLETYQHTLTLLPRIWLIIVILVLLTHSLAEKLMNRFTAEADSFNAKITITILFNVCMIAIVMTLVGPWSGSGHIYWMGLSAYIASLARNMTIAFLVESVIAQPVARAVLYRIHRSVDSK